MPEYRNSCGGFIIEDLAKSGNPYAFHFTQPLSHYRNCNFSFSGIKTKALQYIQNEEQKYGNSKLRAIYYRLLHTNKHAHTHT